MRHLFLQPVSIPLLTHFVVQSAGFLFLITRPRRTQLFRTCQRRTGRAVPVATIAAVADEYGTKTTRAVENPAVL